MPSMLRFALPMMAGNLLQQCYNLADTWIVGRFLGSNALAAVGSSFTLMTFLTSMLLGLCMGSGAVFSMRFGQRDEQGLREGIAASLVLIVALTGALCAAALATLDNVRTFLQVPPEVWPLMRAYLLVVYAGIPATFLYNYAACLLRALGNSLTPLLFLAFSAAANIGLDLLFVLVWKRGVAGAAEATVISQYLSGVGLVVYTLLRCPWVRMKGIHLRWVRIREIARFSFLTCVQQSVMNLGILLVQGLVNSFGSVMMAAFAAAVKIDAFAYMPVQDFGNAFSTFIAQNYGARNTERIRSGFRGAMAVSTGFSVAVSAIVCVLAEPLMGLFVDPSETAVIFEGVRYLRIEGAFYCGIGCLFLLYGLYRALGRPGMSVVLTVLSLGTRVALAYALAGVEGIGVVGIWCAVPIGWALADAVGILYYLLRKKLLLAGSQNNQPASSDAS